jgi:hypothetical protein
MEKRLDRLFKDKLQNNQLLPRHNAWIRINEQLQVSRRMIWRRRLAMAASFLLLISAGVAAYRYAQNWNHTEDVVVHSDTIAPAEQDKKSTDLAADNGLAHAAKATNAPEKAPDVANNTEDGNGPAVEADNTITPAQTPVVNASLTTMKASSVETIKNPVTLPPGQRLVVKSSLEPSALFVEGLGKKEQMAPGTAMLQPSSQQHPGHVPVRIIYKADSDSELVRQSKDNLLEKGFHTIAGFSDKHLVTEEVKARIRSTKSDLLALNFGKLLGKGNNSADN